MKRALESLADLLLDIIEGTEKAYNAITRKPKLEPSLLTYNIDWFTNCSWLEQIVAYKQLDMYHSYKH